MKHLIFQTFTRTSRLLGLHIKDLLMHRLFIVVCSILFKRMTNNEISINYQML